MDFDVASRQRRLFALAGSVLLHGLAFSLLAQGFEGQAPARPVAIQVELVAAQPLPVAMAEATAPPTAARAAAQIASIRARSASTAAGGAQSV